MLRVSAVLMLVSLVALAGNLNPVTVLPNEWQHNDAEVQSKAAPAVSEPAGPQFIIGDLDTVGGSTYDWMANGPIYRFICNSPPYGIHVLWMYSASTSGTTFPDRNMRYNFFDYNTGTWNWIDPDYMASGVNVFTDRSGYGSLDADPASGVAVCTRHYGTGTLSPGLARDMAPGAGIFEYCPGPSGYLWPPLGVGQDGKFHMAMMDDPSRVDIYYNNVATWCNWGTPQVFYPDPNAFPTHNITASKVSQKVCVAWVTGSGPYDAFYNISTDGGTSWLGETQLPAPPAYGGDTVTSFHITSAFPYYDRHDRLHIVVDVMPFVAGQGYVIPADIWHWCPDNTPNWSRIHRATCDPNNLRAAVGYNALYACRPSIGEDRYGGLYVAWEQFDSVNVEPTTNLLRADIFYAQDNGDNGQTWRQAIKLTDGGAGSRRFPSCVDYLSDDSLWVIYEIDGIAGFYVQGQGAVTRNPIVVQKVPVVVGIKAEPEEIPRVLSLSASPNPFRQNVMLSYALPRTGAVELVIYDLSGRPVASLVNGSVPAGRHAATWNASGLAPGVYITKLSANGEVLTQKLVLTQ
ncbi:MAG: T9SS type A sorting domain-containing protein [candidate division WOR-3 bacterium]